jgi:hypothetical protein
MNAAPGTSGARIRYSRDQSEFDRAIAFFDATYAVALTLLATSLDINDRGSAPPQSAIRASLSFRCPRC